ncbi:diguanylate cyclase [Sedimenticola hydrogenitrophicus]|uniref:diguanylate cyclase n=1 Tax=Sedimenticola hydrogenitrophicus TaxID=2967975 RepID=UPI0023AF0E91|nr:diguanylate cyclase [Sedimenticola hydrogenitrophicus]
MPVLKLDGQWREISLPYRSLCSVFPFFLAFDRQGRIRSAGPSLVKLCGALKPGSDFETQFELVTPSIGFGFDRIMGQLFTTFFIRILGTENLLRGQMLPRSDDESELLLFLGTPVVREMSDISRWGLSLKDFAIHDSVIDLLLVLQAKNNTIRDIKRIHDLLEREVETRRKVEQALHELNEQLEQRVVERTRELKRSNQRLGKSLTLLEENNRELRVLNKMGEMLQGCGSLEESLDVISYSLGRLLPHASGFLQLHADATGQPELSITWGGLSQQRALQEVAADCQALQTGEAVLYRSGGDLPRCSHLQGAPECDSVCMPLLANGRCFGLLSLQCFDHDRDRDREPGSDLGFQARLQLIYTAGEHISLALANLRLQETLRQQAVQDSLTGLYNRRYMSATLDREIQRADREDSTVGLVILDIDHFKRINDQHGHETGDRVLKCLGVFLKQRIRGDDVACRFGGEEFVLILPGVGLDDLIRRAERLCYEIAQGEFGLGVDGVPALTVSMGVGLYPAHADAQDDLLICADAALYRAKSAGRNRVVCYQA